MCNNQPKRCQLLSTTKYVLQKTYPTYYMIRNSIVQSLSNMKNKSNDFLSCKTTRHAVKTFLTKAAVSLPWLTCAGTRTLTPPR